MVTKLLTRAGIAAAALALIGGLVTLAGGAPASADTNGGKVGWQYSESGRGYYQDPPSTTTGGGGSPSPNTVIHYTQVTSPNFSCDGNANCENQTHTIYCRQDQPPERRPLYIYSDWHYQWKNRADHDKWIFDGNDCLPTTEWVPVEEISWHFKYQIERNLPKPTIDYSPNPNGLVNLPVILSTKNITHRDFQVTVPPSKGRTFALHGTIHAQAHYIWNLDGKTATGAGRPYDGTDPVTHPGYYVTNTFSTPGTKTIHLQVRWTGTVTVDGLAPEPIEPVTFNVDQAVHVGKSNPVLTR